MGRGSSGARGSGGRRSTSIDVDNLPALTGTERQISYANDIRRRLANTINQFENEAGSGSTNDELLRIAISTVAGGARDKRVWLMPGRNDFESRLSNANRQAQRELGIPVRGDSNYDAAKAGEMRRAKREMIEKRANEIKMSVYKEYIEKAKAVFRKETSAKTWIEMYNG